MPARPTGTPRILVVDDDADDLLFITGAIRKHVPDAQVETCTDGHDLLDRLRGEGAYAGQDNPKPDLITLDLNMPRLAGGPALREIRQDAALRHIPVVILSTSEAESDIEMAYDNGSNAFVTKPHSYQSYLSTIATLCDFWLDVAKLPERAF